MKKIHDDAAPGDGMYPQISEALAVVLEHIVPAMFKAQQPWALMGSLASVLQGMPGYSPPDIDLVTTMEGAYIMEGAISACGATVRPVQKSSAGPYTSYFGIFEVNSIKVEVMGDLVGEDPPGGDVVAVAEPAGQREDLILLQHRRAFQHPAGPAPLGS